MKFSLFEKKEIVMESLEELGFLIMSIHWILRVYDVLSNQEFFRSDWRYFMFIDEILFKIQSLWVVSLRLKEKLHKNNSKMSAMKFCREWFVFY